MSFNVEDLAVRTLVLHEPTARRLLVRCRDALQVAQYNPEDAEVQDTLAYLNNLLPETTT